MVAAKPAVLLAVWLATLAAAAGQEFHVYIGEVTENSVLVAWGTTEGRNTIGRGSPSYGPAQLRIGDRTVQADGNWARVTGLKPDTRYEYEVSLKGKRIGGSSVRTWPERARKMAFFVIGDFGNGSSGQRRIAEVMWERFRERADGDNPVRFILTVGDNIYASLKLIYTKTSTGDDDRHWKRKFFEPYARLIEQVPFLPTIGNHDGNASENQADLAVYLDNFFFPENRPARWYRFGFGGLADFFALDSGDNSLEGPPKPVYLEDGEQFAWMKKEMAASRAPWKIPYFHHPLFNAGPRHGASLAILSHWVDLFQKSGVKVVFTGHEHNFQFSERSLETRGITFVITGAGGELRGGSVMANMARAHIAGWSAQHHFLEVEIEGETMRITPHSFEKITVRGVSGENVRTPLSVGLK